MGEKAELVGKMITSMMLINIVQTCPKPELNKKIKDVLHYNSKLFNLTQQTLPDVVQKRIADATGVAVASSSAEAAENQVAPSSTVGRRQLARRQ